MSSPSGSSAFHCEKPHGLPHGGVQDIPHHVFDGLGQGGEELRCRGGEADRVRLLCGHRRLPRSSAMSMNSLSS